MSPPAAAPGIRRRRKDARPGEIIDAAFQVFTEKGFAATRLDEVAARAGISKGTLYLYFPSKEELFKAMVRQTVLPDIDGLERMAATFAGPTADLFRQVLARMAQVFTATRIGRLPKIVIAETATFPDLARFWVAEVVERGKALMRAVVARGVATGEFTPVQAEAVLVLFAPILLLTLWNNAIGPAVGRLLDPAEFAAQAAGILLDGLKARETPP